jgi:glucosylceramidase
MSEITVWKTTKDDLGCKQVDYSEVSNKLNNCCVKAVSINLEKEYQEILGFGGAFNEVGWEAISALDAEGKNKVMNSLFGKNECDFSLCRTPIGASDFAMNAYSLNDTENDFQMKNFSINRDKELLIPYIKEALNTKPETKIWSCPWSPPYWMKTNKDMCNGGELIDTPENLRAYAKYLAKYLEAYKNEGINIYGFCVQNETDVINVYPTSTMTNEVMTKFIRAYLLPEMIAVGKKRPPETEIWAGTVRDVLGYVDEIVTDMVNKEFVTGIGYQYSSGRVVGDSYAKFPNKKLIHTESPCHNGANSWEEAKEIFLDILMYLENGCMNYCYWNMVLNETGLSTWNWKQNSMITVDRNSKEVIFNPEFYVMKHFSQFISKGAKRVEASGDYDNSYIAFKNPDDSVVVVLNNFDMYSKSVAVNIDGNMITANVEADSIYTFIIDKN